MHPIEPTGRETTRNHPFTAKWVLQRVQEDPVERARVHLQVWAPKREREYSDSFIKELRRLDQPTGVEVLKTLKKGKGYVRGTRGNSLTIKVVLQNLEGTRAVTARTLVDSGSTGSCIDRKFVEEHGLTTHRSPVTVTVYNADGTVNKCCSRGTRGAFGSEAGTCEAL